MPRVRWAVQCHAKAHGTGQRCVAWAVRGCSVCVVHGGQAPQVRQEGAARLFEIAARRAFDRAYAEWQRRLRDFHADRLLVAAQLLGKPVDEVDRWDIIWCHSQHGVPPLEDDAPKITDVPLDRRFARFRGGANRQVVRS